MAHYIVGDIQGCYRGLRKLLKKVQFDASRDHLWAVGDLVARGDDSLSTLEFLYDMGDQFHTVLGNHDLHLIAIANGIRNAKPNDNLGPLMASPALPRLIDWLRQQPLARRIDKHTLLVHAGLYPQWSLKRCEKLSEKVSKRLRSDNHIELLQQMYGNHPTHWSPELSGMDQLRFVINACTRMRFLERDGALNFAAKESPTSAPTSIEPWFNIENSNLKPKQRVIFGHWAALNGLNSHSQYFGLDTGYVWGGALTALRLEDMKFFLYNKT